MDRFDFFKEALQAGAYKRKDWIISVFTVVRHKPYEGPQVSFGITPSVIEEKNPDYPYRVVILPHDKHGLYFLDPNNAFEPTKIDNVRNDLPMLSVHDKITLKPNDLANVTEEVETWCGNVLFNAMVLVHSVGNKIPYQNGRVNGEKIDRMLAARMVDNPKDGEEVPPNAITVDEYKAYATAMAAMAGLTQISTPAASPKSMTIDPAILKRRDELLKEYKDQLHDPAIIAKIEGELVAMDKATFANDPAGKFYIKSKTYDVARKKSFIMMGAELGFSSSQSGVDPITTSLREGWDMNRLPQMVDNLRSGSYNRGHETALGGESVKYFYRIFQNTRVLEDDCGTKISPTRLITKKNIPRLVGLFSQDVVENGQQVPLTDEKLNSLVGKVIRIRSPRTCTTEAPSFCAKCVGVMLARNPTGLHIAASNIGSTFMGSFMASTHGEALKTERYDFRAAIK